MCDRSELAERCQSNCYKTPNTFKDKRDVKGTALALSLSLLCFRFFFCGAVLFHCCCFIPLLIFFFPHFPLCMCVCACVCARVCTHALAFLWLCDCVCLPIIGGFVWFACVCVCSDDEHMLIQHYCQSLNQGSPLSQPRSPAQILISMETEEKGELERVLNDLEQENRSVNRPVLSIIIFLSFLYSDLNLNQLNLHRIRC